MPFASEHRISAPKGTLPDGASPGLRDLLTKHYLHPAESYRRIEEDWLISAGALALRLDNDTNNTSLVLAFEFTNTPAREVFLFPGDAQVGNWLSWDKCRWVVNEANSEKHTVNAQDLLARTVFYKVGHHGSHNATLKAGGLERMTSRDLVAMIPVNQAMAKAKRWKMPWPHLRKRLDEMCSSLIVQDEGQPAKKPRHGHVTLHQPAKQGEEPLYIDYQL